MPVVPKGTGRVPPTPSELSVEWISFADAIVAIATALGAELIMGKFYLPADPTEDEQAVVFEASAQLRNALSRGDLIAWGTLGSGESKPLAPIEWSTREVKSYEGEWSNSPYVRFQVRRTDVLRLWPSDRPKVTSAGRPTKIDWGEVKARALSVVASDPLVSRYKLTEILRVGLTAGVHERTIKKKLAQWGLGTAPRR